MNFTTSNIDIDRAEILEMIADKKKHGTFKVIDVGGDAGGWSKSHIDCLVDINAEDSPANFKMDICKEGDWTKILNHVEVNGKFDYCICSHTLEDVYNPYTAMQMFPQIAKAGVIMVPYYQTELSHVENPIYRGYIHHRYLFKEKNGKIFLAPKMPFLEKINFPDFPSVLVNFRIDWENSIEYEIFMNNYLGPTTHHIINNFVSEFGQ